MLDIQFIQGITDEAYNSRYWVGQIEFIFRLCGLIAIGLYLNVTKGVYWQVCGFYNWV